MVRHSVFRWPVAVLALAWAGPAAADADRRGHRPGTAVSPLFATGNVEKDFAAVLEERHGRPRPGDRTPSPSRSG